MNELKRAFVRRLGQATVASNSDKVLTSIVLPANTVVHSIKGTLSCVASEISVLNACSYWFGGYILPVLDPDSAILADVLWDDLVPKDKDVATGGFDMDTNPADTTPVDEPGEQSMDMLMGIDPLDIQRVYARRRLITVADSPVKFVEGTPDLYLPMDKFHFNIKKPFRVTSPSMLLMAVSSPVFDDTQVVAGGGPATEQVWVQLQFVKHTMELMWTFLIGLATEGGGALTPFDEAANTIANFVEETVHEETAGAFAPVTWTAFQEVTVDLSLEGEKKFGALTSGE